MSDNANPWALKIMGLRQVIKENNAYIIELEKENAELIEALERLCQRIERDTLYSTHGMKFDTSEERSLLERVRGDGDE